MFISRSRKKMKKIMIVKRVEPEEKDEKEEEDDYLFIEKLPSRMSQPCHRKQQQQHERRVRKTRLGKLEQQQKRSKLIDFNEIVRRPNKKISLLLLAAITTICCCSSQCLFFLPSGLTALAASDEQAAAIKLPTVIVRGFLNYRTTVDGTVLLFTPDVGGQPNSAASAQPAATATAISASSSSPISLELAPIQPEPTQTASPGAEFRPQAYQHQEADREENQWRPVQATPPLKSIQTTYQPARQQQHLQTSSMLISSDSSAGRNFLDETSGNLGHTVAVGGLSQEVRPKLTTEQSTEIITRPSVQTDELSTPTDHLQQHKQQQPSRAVTKARRPSLGFHGQGARANSRPNANQAEQAAGSINGIRRPGLPTTTTTTTIASVDQQQDHNPQAAQPIVSAFQARLQSAKLRNKFRKPGSSALGTPASLASNSTTLTGSSASEAAGAGAAEEVEKEGLHQVGSSTSSSIVSGNQWPVAAELQPRLGDIFNPGAVISPMVGSDEVLSDSSPSKAESATSSDQQDAQHDPNGSSNLELRLGEQRPRSEPDTLLTGGLTGTIENSGAPLPFDSFFQNDQPPPTVGASKPGQVAILAASEHKPNHLAPRKKIIINNNDKINGRLDHYHNKFAPRPASAAPGSTQTNLAPSFASNIPSVAAPRSSQPSQAPTLSVTSSSGEPSSVTKPTVGSALDEPTSVEMQPAQQVAAAAAAASNNSLSTLPASAPDQVIDGTSGENSSLQMQTITKTYSTVMTSLKTRLVPLQVKSSTGVHTLTESYVITKLMTAYQTMPVGEFILPEPLSTRAPFEIFNEPEQADQAKSSNNIKEVQQAASNFVAQPVQAVESQQQEQPITLNENPKGANDWLHDFSSQNPFNPVQPQQQQQQQLAALLEQQAQEANLGANFGLSGEPLDQLASSLDPAALLADGSINIPDLNNPLVLAAAIQNPQLAAVILAAQQLRLRQQQQRTKQQNGNTNQQQAGANQLQLQPSYSTSLSTNIKPSTYTVRDTMYTTRLVSFKDGRTVRTRTVSEPGSVIEQILTTMATEIIPITITIRPTGVLAVPSMQATAANNQATINNALFATQLANLLARRQQQVQPSTGVPAPSQSQLALLQQLLAGQQQQLSGAASRPQQQQFQPNLQQLLQSMQQQQSPSGNPNAQQANNNSGSGNSNNKPPPQTSASGQAATVAAQQDSGANKPETAQQSATPPLPGLPSKPIVTILTNLQVRTYTVHNAFKTIYRTITSTQLVTSTILPAMTRNSQLALVG